MPERDILSAAEGLLRRYAIEPHIVRSVIGELRREWGGGSTYVQSIDRQARDDKIDILLERGVSVGRIAREAKCHEATVRRRRSKWL